MVCIASELCLIRGEAILGERRRHVEVEDSAVLRTDRSQGKRQATERYEDELLLIAQKTPRCGCARRLLGLNSASNARTSVPDPHDPHLHAYYP